MFPSPDYLMILLVGFSALAIGGLILIYHAVRKLARALGVQEA